MFAITSRLSSSRLKRPTDGGANGARHTARPRPFAWRSVAVLLLVSGPVMACGNDDPFRSIATVPNVISGVSVATFSTGTTGLSAIDLVNLRAVRPEVQSNGSTNFQVAIDADAGGQLRIFPVLALVSPPSGAAAVGLLRSTAAFNALDRAPTSGFVDDTAQTASVGEAFIFRVNAGTCAFGDPLYGKLEIESFSTATQRATVRFFDQSQLRLPRSY